MLAKGKIDYKELAYRDDSINVNNDAGYFSFNFSADGILLKDKNTKVNLSYTSENGNISNIKCLINNIDDYYIFTSILNIQLIQI